MVTMLNRSLITAENNSYIGSKTAIYGVEATLPKASCGTSDRKAHEIIKHDDYSHKRLYN